MFGTRWHSVAIEKVASALDDPRVVGLIDGQVCVTSNPAIMSGVGRVAPISCRDAADARGNFSCELVDVERNTGQLFGPPERGRERSGKSVPVPLRDLQTGQVVD